MSDDTKRRIEDVLKHGSFPSADEVVRAALAALDELGSLVLDEAAFDAIDRAEDQIDVGAVHDWSTVRAQVRAKFRS